MMESRVLPATRPETHSLPEQQVSHRLADARLERRELAQARARAARRKAER